MRNAYRWSDKAGRMIEAQVREGASALEIQEALDKEENKVKVRIVRDEGTYNYRIVEDGHFA